MRLDRSKVIDQLTPTLLLLSLPFANAAFPAEGNQPRADIVTIEIGNLVAQEFTIPWLNQEIDRFNETHPNIHVQAGVLNQPKRYRTPLHEQDHLPRNILGIDSWQGGEVAYLVERGELVSIDSFLPDPEFSFLDYYANYWDAVTYGGARWGVPWLAESNVILCDWALFEAAGIHEPPRTWAELMSYAERLTDVHSKIPQWGLRLRQNGTLLNLLTSFMFQHGGEVIVDHSFTTPNPEAAAGLIEFMNIIEAQDRVRQDSRPLNEVLLDQSVRYAMHLVSSNELASVLERRDFRIAPVPSTGAPLFVAPGRLYYAIRKSSTEEQLASWELVKWLSRKDVSLPRIPLGYPCRKDVVERYDFQRLADGGVAGLDILFTGPGRERDLGGFVLNRGRAFDRWGRSIGMQILRGETDTAKVLRNAKTAGDKELQPLSSLKKGGDPGIDFFR